MTEEKNKKIKKVKKVKVSGIKVPKKYTNSDDGQKERMAKEIKKFKNAKDSSPYFQWSGDTDPKTKKTYVTKKSSATKKYNEVYGSDHNSLKNKSKKTGINLTILKQVYKRGLRAWQSGHRPGTRPNQWAMGRVNSFITGKGKSRIADKDLWEKHKLSKKEKK